MSTSDDNIINLLLLALHEALQKKTFTRWMNSHLNKVSTFVCY